MPCPCRKPQPSYPEPVEWGPTLWKILHSFAERSGRITNPMFQADEKRQWVLLLTTLPQVIPCDHCREHAAAWIATHPIAPLRDLPYAEVHGWLVDYLYMLHDAVNSRLSKPAFDRATLATTYGAVNPQDELRRITPTLQIAIQLSGVRLLSWRAWKGYALMLASFYGL